MGDEITMFFFNGVFVAGRDEKAAEEGSDDDEDEDGEDDEDNDQDDDEGVNEDDEDDEDDDEVDEDDDDDDSSFEENSAVCTASMNACTDESSYDGMRMRARVERYSATPAPPQYMMRKSITRPGIGIGSVRYIIGSNVTEVRAQPGHVMVDCENVQRTTRRARFSERIYSENNAQEVGHDTHSTNSTMHTLSCP